MKALSALVEATDQQGTPRSRIPVAKFGAYKDRRYGEFQITPEMAGNWRENLSSVFGGQVAIDLDHSPEKRGTTEAAGWIKGLEADGKYVYGEIEWTPLGEQAIRERRYLYVSPTFAEDYTDETGEKHGHALVGMALTNRPVLRRDMPTLNLSRDDFALELELSAEVDGEIGLATIDRDERDRLARSGEAMSDGSFPIRNRSDLANAVKAHGRAKDPAAARAHIVKRARALGATGLLPDDWQPSSDSRTAMADISENVVKALGIDGDADEQIVLDAITALKAQPDTRTLEQQAEADGKIVLDQAAVEELKTLAAAGQSARDELDRNRFEGAFEKALSEGRCAPAQRERLQKLYTLDRDETLALLADLPKIVNTRPAGSADAAEVPEGVDPDEHRLNRQVVSLMAEHKLDYAKALDMALAGSGS